MKRLIFLLIGSLTLSGMASPLFPDVPDNHWSRDAVAALAAKGLLEGYPDGTFKGDRSASRWETALIVARLLSKMEQAHATFATKAELDSLRQLATALQEELGALGIRVDQLEEQTERIDKRVSELERITFYGSVETRVVFQSFTNQGIGDNDGLRNGGGNPSNTPFLNYNNAVGSALGATRRPQLNGIFPVVDFKRGRALTSGTGFTARATLGLNVQVTEEIDAGVEFSAYSSQGDRNIDAYWGVSAPYLSNIFTGNAANGTQSLNNTPYTRMNLDKFWVRHLPSNTQLTVGEILKTNMDSIVYAGQPNLGVFGPKRWAGYGFDLQGEADLNEDSLLRWEILGTRYGNGNAFLGTNYQNYVLAGNLAYLFNKKAGKLQLNYARLAEEANGGGPLLVGGFGPGGGTTGINVPSGNSVGWTVRQWVNPPGFFAAQQSAFHQANAGQVVGGVLVPNTVDNRPIPGWNGAADNALGIAAGGGGGNYGPQSQDTVGLTGRYRWTLGEQDEAPTLTISGEWARSNYRPNRNSRYDVDGDAFRVGLESTLLEEDLDLGFEYLSVDPTYAPTAYFGNALGLRFPRNMNFTGVWHHHDFVKYPHNREGFRLKGKWRFDQDRGSVWAKASFLEQKQTSLYDVRIAVNGLGAGSPNSTVLGFSPGFVDPIFYGFAHPNLYGAASGNSFTNTLAPLENPNGSDDNYQFGASYRWGDPGIRLSASYGHTDLDRQSGLSPAFGGDQNQVNIDVDIFNIEAKWDVDDVWSFTGGVDYTQTTGHYDPSGLYHSYAVATGSNSFTNLDSTQVAPYLAVDCTVSDKSSWNIMLRHYDTNDSVDPQVRAGTALDSFGSSAHPFDWDGWQVSTHYRLNF